MRTFFGEPFTRWTQLRENSRGELEIFFRVSVGKKISAVWFWRLSERIVIDTYNTHLETAQWSPFSKDLSIHSSTPLEAEEFNPVGRKEKCEWLDHKSCWAKIVMADDVLLKAIKAGGSDAMFEKMEDAIIEALPQGILEV